MFKKLTVTFAVALCALALSAQAGEGKHKLTPEQKALQKEMLEKYDANKDGKLDKAERAKISLEDKDRMQKAGLLHNKKSKHSS